MAKYAIEVRLKSEEPWTVSNGADGQPRVYESLVYALGEFTGILSVWCSAALCPRDGAALRIVNRGNQTIVCAFEVKMCDDDYRTIEACRLALKPARVGRAVRH